MVEICDRRALSPGTANLKPVQAADDQGNIRRFINDGEKLQKCLFKVAEIVVLLQEIVFDSHY